MVPKLRLSLFKDDKSSRWSLAKLGEIVEFKKGKGISKSDISKNGVYPCVRYGELYTIYNEKIDKVLSKTNCAPNEHVISKSGDILIPASGENAVDIARASAILRDDVILGGDINILSPKSNSLNSLFLSYSIVGKKKMELAKMAQGNSVVHLYSSQLKTLEIWLPLIDEQTRVAEFLSSVDEKITLLDKQYKQLCQYKKGMMQKIFSQQLRFKDDSGDDFSDWEEVELKKIASKVKSKNRDNSVSTVLTNSATLGIVCQESYFEREIVTESNLTGYYVVEIGDFVYNPRISSTAPVGPIKLNELSQGVMSPLYTVFRFNKGLLKFYQYFFESSVWHDYMKSVANSGARHDRMNISGADFFDLPIPQPSDEEQTKIARFLSAIDSKITTNKAKLDKLKIWKQGLLQQMFV
ncbi:restriction endonuclease subunit S [Escherichia coli]|uniref:restriction endonuclease subunit S n=1 Tax=Escherichia coli TaxID=562 RepID=UPI0018836C8C|nr:restriction endonuclease subunit S [Escherichia coli]MBE9776154.1 restriction endonuclease subunit S [Escherichia coli]MBE9974207.1 restriction endonuclease subunit S [Escherichia coli]